MIYLFLEKFSNYSSRKIYRLDTRMEYIAGRLFCELSTNNFNPNDGIEADAIVNWPKEWEPDYMVLLTDDQKVSSRWFVMEWIRTRGGQYRAVLRRDVLADYLGPVMKAKAIVERGPLSPTSPYIFNAEDFSLNRIKKREQLIKDETATPWIVGYVSSDTDAPSPISISGPDASSYPSFESLDLKLIDPSHPTSGAVFDVMETAPMFGFLADFWINAPAVGYNLKFLYSSGNGLIEEDHSNPFWPQTSIEFQNYNRQDYVPLPIRQIWDSLVKASAASLTSELSLRDDVREFSDLGPLLSANGKVFYSSNDHKYYKLTVTRSSPAAESFGVARSSDAYPSLFFALSSLVSQYADAARRSLVDGDKRVHYIAPTESGDYLFFKYRRATLSFAIEEVAVDGQSRIGISNQRRKLIDAPFDMFCMKYTQRNLQLAQALLSAPPADPENETKRLYDVQIVPFCPRRDYIENGMSLSGMTEGSDYQYIQKESGGTWVNDDDVLFWCLRSSDSFSVDVSVPVGQTEGTSTAEALKVANECDFVRLCGPNYAAVFEFSPAKNGGVSSFRIDFTYKPILPYIHIAPVFSGLYGSFNDDARGLIVSGDMSVDTISDAWTQYVTSNKNFREIFDTNIKTLDASHDLQKIDRALGIAGGSAAAGVATGLKTGNVYAGIGAAAVAAGTGLYNLAMFDKQYEITRSQAIRAFRLNLGNIQATPQTLTKATAYNINNKYFPVIEFYSCTDEERLDVLNYIREFNYKIGILGSFEEAMEASEKDMEYLRGEIVRFDSSLASDQHTASEIAYEVKGGFYLWNWKRISL